MGKAVSRLLSSEKVWMNTQGQQGIFLMSNLVILLACFFQLEKMNKKGFLVVGGWTGEKNGQSVILIHHLYTSDRKTIFLTWSLICC